jgi:DNA-binding PadR family transcriptional regulator
MHGGDFGWKGPHRRRFGPPPFAPFGVPPWADVFGGRPRGRARRGDVRVAVLALLAEGPRHGYEIIHELAHRSHGAWHPSPGSIYPTLQLLEDEGLVRGVEVDGKRRYEITEEGRAHLAENPRASAPWDEMARSVDPGRVELGEALRHVGMAMHQVFEVGTEDQRRQAVGLLTELRRQLYVLLASDGDAPAQEAAPAPAQEAPPTAD